MLKLVKRSGERIAMKLIHGRRHLYGEISSGRRSSVPGRVRNRSYDLNGKLLWEFGGPTSGLVIPSPFQAHDLCYITSGYVGDKTASNLRDQAWCQRQPRACR